MGQLGEPSLPDLGPLQQFLQNSHPIVEKNFFDVVVGKPALNQLPGQIACVGVVCQIRNKMRPR